MELQQGTTLHGLLLCLWRLESKITSRFIHLRCSCGREVGQESNGCPFPPALVHEARPITWATEMTRMERPLLFSLLSSPGLDTDICLSSLLVGNASSSCFLQMLHLWGSAAPSEKIPTMPEWISLQLAATSPQSKEHNLTYCKLKEKLSRQSRPRGRREEEMLKGPGAVVEALLAPVNHNWRGKRGPNRVSGYKSLPAHLMETFRLHKAIYIAPFCDLRLVMNCSACPGVLLKSILFLFCTSSALWDRYHSTLGLAIHPQTFSSPSQKPSFLFFIFLDLPHSCLWIPALGSGVSILLCHHCCQRDLPLSLIQDFFSSCMGTIQPLRGPCTTS